MVLTLRGGRASDAQRCGQICFDAFSTFAEHHNFPRDFPSPEVASDLMSLIFANPDVYSVVAERDGQIVGSNFLWESGPIVGVGPITIDPAAQNASVGRALMSDVLQRAAEQNRPGVRLVQAAYHGRSLSLYTKLGFVAREPLSCMQGPAIGRTVPGFPVRAAREADVAACAAVCHAVHGHDRSRELQGAIAQGTATVVEHDGRIVGYATLIGFFGHAVAESDAAMQSLIGAASSFAGPGFLLPTRNAVLLRWCLESGLRIVQPMTLMSIGMYNEPAGAFIPSILF